MHSFNKYKAFKNLYLSDILVNAVIPSHLFLTTISEVFFVSGFLLIMKHNLEVQCSFAINLQYSVKVLEQDSVDTKTCLQFQQPDSACQLAGDVKMKDILSWKIQPASPQQSLW